MNFQNLIIFCVLLVTVTAKLPTYKPNRKANLTPEERLDNFEHLLIQFQTNNNADASSSKNWFIAKYDMTYFKDTSPDFKENCLKAFEERIARCGLDYNSDKNSLEKISIHYFTDKVCQAIDRLYESIPKENEWGKKIKKELHSMREGGAGLHFLAYYNKLEIPEPGPIGEEARWTFILNKFNGGKIIENYRVPVQGIQKLMEKCCLKH